MTFKKTSLNQLVDLAETEQRYCSIQGWTDGENRWSATLARLQFLQTFDEAWIHRLTESIGILRASQQTHDLCSALVWRAAAWLVEDSLDDASADVNEALSIAGPRSWKPLQCDCYLLRAQIRHALHVPMDEVWSDRSTAAQMAGETRYVSLFR